MIRKPRQICWGFFGTKDLIFTAEYIGFDKVAGLTTVPSSKGGHVKHCGYRPFR